MTASRELVQWVITYDKNGMPGIVEGLKVSTKKIHRLTNIFSLDLNRLTLIDNDGKTWKLTGPGVQSILVEHVEPFSFVEVHPDDPEEDDEEDYDG